MGFEVTPETGLVATAERNINSAISRDFMFCKMKGHIIIVTICTCCSAVGANYTDSYANVLGNTAKGVSNLEYIRSKVLVVQ